MTANSKDASYGIGEENPETSYHNPRMNEFHSLATCMHLPHHFYTLSSSGSINGETTSAYHYVIVAERGSLAGGGGGP